MKIQVQFTAEELRRICHDLASELNNDMGRVTGFDDDDLANVLKEWSEYSPHYVFSSMQKEGCDLESAEANREAHDETADLLERLICLLPIEEVSHVR